MASVKESDKISARQNAVNIIVADEIDVSPAFKLPKKKFHTAFDFGISNEDLLRRYFGFDVLVIRSVRKIDSEFIRRSSFKVIATCSKGTDHIDVKSALKKRIVVLNADDSNNISAAEHTLALILAACKNLLHSDSLVRKGKFADYAFQRNELYGKRIGIIGFGKVGSYVGKLCKAFGMKVIANDTDRKVVLRNRNFEFRSLSYVLKNCGIITIHIPLEKKNFRFFDRKKFDMMKSGVVFINTSRGDVVDEDALLSKLKSGEISFAGLDVFSNEPNIRNEFSSLQNALLSNHIAGKTQESRMRVSENIFGQIRDMFMR